MSVLRSIEGKIEGLFEGVFGRAFRTHVQPVELARKLAKEMDEHRSVSVSRVYVPNEYTVFLAPADREQFAGYEGSLVGELQEYLVEHARREGYAMLTPPRVLLSTDTDLAVGEFGIATRLVEQSETSLPPVQSAGGSPTPPVVAATMIYRPVQQEPEVEEPDVEEPDVEEPAAIVRERITLALDGRVVEVASSRMVIGRSRECDLQIDDVNASRRHCEVAQDGPTSWSLVDLGSTNGTELNGRRVERAPLTDGDRITIGGTDIFFGRAAS